MIESLIILSDIHGNLSALESVICDIEVKGYRPDGVAILGDNINYGMRPNEVIGRLKDLSEKHEIIVNLCGNHEKALLDMDTTHFSTDRGRRILDFTRDRLNVDSMAYIDRLTRKGYTDLSINGKRFLFIHGSIDDPYWGKLDSETISDSRYSGFDFVVSGHSHTPQLIEQFYPDENPEYRNKKRTVFLNPGSVGQPRNHNPRAQYLYFDIGAEIFHFNSVPYDIKSERVLFNGKVDSFYSDRLIKGI